MDKESWLVIRRALYMIIGYSDKKYGVEKAEASREG